MFEKNTGKVVARRLHKFFNIGEAPETRPDNIKLDQDYVITEKVDGCLISPVLSKGKIVLASKNGPTKMSQAIEENYIGKHPDKRFHDFFEKWLSQDFSIVCEWVSPEDPIVLTYPEPVLFVIAIRNNTTGNYVPFHDMQASCQEYNVPAIKEWDGSDMTASNVAELMERIKHLKGVEGAVIRFNDGRMFKLKTEWYFSQSKSHLALPNQERDVWAMVLDSKVDDLLPQLSAEVTKKLQDFQVKLFSAVDEISEKYQDITFKLKAEAPTKRDFVAKFKDQFSLVEFALISKIYDGQDSRLKTIETLRGQCAVKKFEEVKKLFGLTHLYFYKPSSYQ
eukprot:TRINITY_DN9623_c0_g1_i2.p1 TRINITY_DN9623_c0_g1~~TRINITY_DN9623_c0_g1_i2.p1  ORF type:complete len:336 (-),score=119.52 TRINITY_DN9623_c0_g1_i2:230-1237(-)